MKRAFIFPGQGSQSVGMGKALADAFPQAKAVFDEVDEALSQKLSALMWEGPAEELTLTANAQPALMAVSLAAFRVLEAEAGLDLEGTPPSSPATRSANIRRLRPPAACRSPIRRGSCAFAATPCRTPCRWGRAPWRRCSASIRRGPEVAARGGSRRGLRCGQRQWRRPGRGLGPQGGRRAGGRHRPGQGRQARHDAAVSAPFHCALMQPAADAMREALAAVTDQCARGAARRQCAWPRPITDPARSASAWSQQVTGTVRWRESVA